MKIEKLYRIDIHCTGDKLIKDRWEKVEILEACMSEYAVNNIELANDLYIRFTEILGSTNKIGISELKGYVKFYEPHILENGSIGSYPEGGKFIRMSKVVKNMNMFETSVKEIFNNYKN